MVPRMEINSGKKNAIRNRKILNTLKKNAPILWNELDIFIISFLEGKYIHLGWVIL